MATWFISGASSGIGAEMARQVAARGDHVALAARRVQRLEELAVQLRPLGVQATVHELDVADGKAVDRVIRAADAAHADNGGLGVVVVNAGVGGGARIGTGRHTDNVAMFEVNLLGAMAQMDTAIELFRARGRGTVAVVASVAAQRALPGSMGPYGASKAALRMLATSTRSDLAGSGVHVTTLLPGFVESEMTEDVPKLLKADTDVAVAQMIKAIDERADEAWVPTWWKPVAKRLMPIMPDAVLRRFS